MTARDGGHNVSDRQAVVRKQPRIGRDPFSSRALRQSGSALRASSDLQSDNFEEGSEGWRLQRETGDAELNDVTVRGTIEATGGSIDGTLAVNGTLRGESEADNALVRAQFSGGKFTFESGDPDSDPLVLGTAGSIAPIYDEANSEESFLRIAGYDIPDEELEDLGVLPAGANITLGQDRLIRLISLNDTGMQQSSFSVGPNSIGFFSTGDIFLGPHVFEQSGDVLIQGDTELDGEVQVGGQLRRQDEGTLFDKTSISGVTVNSDHLQVARNGGVILHANRQGSDGALISCRRAGTQVGSISVTTSATSFNTSSDYRLKANFEAMAGALERVGLLRPGTFDWKAGGAGEGFLAHELAEVVPDAVTGEKDGDEYQVVDHSKLVPLLVAAVQELAGQVAALQATVSDGGENEE